MFVDFLQKKLSVLPWLTKVFFGTTITDYSQIFLQQVTPQMAQLTIVEATVTFGLLC